MTSPPSRRPRLIAAFTLTALLTTTLATSGRPEPSAAVDSAVAVAPPQQLGRWTWPIPPPRAVVRGFEAPPTRYAAGHRGIDIAAPAGTVVTAPESGVVHFAGTVVGRPALTLEHDGGLLSSFEPVVSSLAPGQLVRRGQPIGTVASGGHCDSRCVHLGVRLNGEYVSPLLFLGGVRRAVLLPL